MATFIQDIANYLASWNSSVNLVVAAALTIIGFAFIIPTDTTKKFAKSALPWVLLGAGIVLGATNIATEYVNSFTFTQ